MGRAALLSFRVPSAFKAELQALAMKEGQSIAQVCEAFIRGGLEAYKKEGSKYVQRFLSRHTGTET